jgi:hypothetical protein
VRGTCRRIGLIVEGHENECTILATGVGTQTDDFSNRLFETGGDEARKGG